VVFIVIPLAAGWLTRTALLRPTAKIGLSKLPAEISSGDDRGPAPDTRFDFLLPIKNSPTAGCRSAHCRADYHPGLFQFRPDVFVDARCGLT